MALTVGTGRNPLVVKGTLTATTAFTGQWKKFLVKNLDAAQAFEIQINNELSYTVEALAKHGDAYQDAGIRTFTLVNIGGAPGVELVLHN